MANEIEKLNTIEITDIEKVNTLTDANIEKINTLEFAGYGGTAGSWHGARFVAIGSTEDGGTFVNNIQYKAATSTGDAGDFGDAQEAYAFAAGFSNGTRMVAMDGEI